MGRLYIYTTFGVDLYGKVIGKYNIYMDPVGIMGKLQSFINSNSEFFWSWFPFQNRIESEGIGWFSS